LRPSFFAQLAGELWRRPKEAFSTMKFLFMQASTVLSRDESSASGKEVAETA
jgi:hypothetical protein